MKNMTMTEQETAVFLIAYFGFLAVFCLAMYVIYSLPLSQLFKRAGERPWKAWVPFVNQYTRTKIVFGQDKAWWFLIDFVLGGLFNLYLTYNEARAFGKEPLFAVLHLLFQPVTTWILWLTKAEFKGKQKFLLD